MVQIKRNLPKGNTLTLIILHDRRSSQFVSGLDHFRVLDYFGNAVDFETVASMNENTKVNYQITLSEAIDDFVIITMDMSNQFHLELRGWACKKLLRISVFSKN